MEMCLGGTRTSLLAGGLARYAQPLIR